MSVNDSVGSMYALPTISMCRFQRLVCTQTTCSFIHNNEKCQYLMMSNFNLCRMLMILHFICKSGWWIEVSSDHPRELNKLFLSSYHLYHNIAIFILSYDELLNYLITFNLYNGLMFRSVINNQFLGGLWLRQQLYNNTDLVPGVRQIS